MLVELAQLLLLSLEAFVESRLCRHAGIVGWARRTGKFRDSRGRRSSADAAMRDAEMREGERARLLEGCFWRQRFDNGEAFEELR